MNLDYLSDYVSPRGLEELGKISATRLAALKKNRNGFYQDCLERLPRLQASHTDFESETVSIGTKEDISQESLSQLLKVAKDLLPWRKGPFNLFGEVIDTEWRSEKKWNRLVDKIGPLSGCRILDIGANNGYYMFKMLAQNPEMVLGIDPFYSYFCQYQLLQNIVQSDRLHFELFGVEQLPYFESCFDVVFSMGIIYHHRDPLGQLLAIRDSLRPGGRMVLETIGIPGESSTLLLPEDRYAKMKNVWFLPTLSALINMCHRSKFVDIEVISQDWAAEEEQRSTPWCPPPHESLADFLSPTDPTKTIEGHPAPKRFCILAKKNPKAQR